MTTKTSRKQKSKDIKFAFARHESFHFREQWLHKGLTFLAEDSTSLAGKGVHHNLGLGKNMADSLRYWMQASCLAIPDPAVRKPPRPLLLSAVAESILEHDPYLEDAFTIWLIHLELASNERLATMWYWIFNEYGNRDFNAERIVISIEEMLNKIDTQNTVKRASLEKDFNCFIRTYLPAATRSGSASAEMDCPLSTLGLIRPSGTPGMYRFATGPHRDMPTPVFLYSLYKFREATLTQNQTIGLEDVRWRPLSPGRLLCLDNRSISERLEEIEYGPQKLAEVIRTAGLSSVYLDPDTTSIDIVKDYYSRGE